MLRTVSAPGRILIVAAFLIGSLTLLVAPAAGGQQSGTSQPTSNANAAFLPHQGVTVQVRQYSLPTTGNPGSVSASHLPAGKSDSVAPGVPGISFAPVVAYESGGTEVNSVAIADLRGDGKLDLIVANDCATSGCGTIGNVAILLGNDDGTFQPPVPYDSGGSDSISVAVADVNGDGKPDVVVANYGSGTLGVLLGNGDGTLQPPVTYALANSGPLTGEADSITIADVNGDGKPDLVVSLNCGQVNILLGNGNGTFQPPTVYGESEGPYTYVSTVVADVNGDGKPDLIMTNIASFVVGVALGNGDGTFQSAVESQIPNGPVSVAVSDVNGDGKLDLIVANGCTAFNGCYYYSGVSVLLGNGDGTFQTPVFYSSGGLEYTSVAVADVNRDGKPDLVLAGCSKTYCGGAPDGSVGVMLGNGDGTFEPAQFYDSGGRGGVATVVADVNADGWPDVVVADWGGTSTDDQLGAIGVLLNSSGCVSSCQTFTALASSLNPSAYGEKVTFTATVTGSPSVPKTGTVSFTWSGNTIGSAKLNSAGVATFTRSNLNVDTYPLVAIYRGDANNLGGRSAIVNQVVNQTTSSATLTSSPNPSAVGENVTFTAKITSPTVAATGPVTFTAGKTVLGTGQLSGGKAKFTISTLAAGSTTVKATYYGDSNIAKSSASVTQTVQQ